MSKEKTLLIKALQSSSDDEAYACLKQVRKRLSSEEIDKFFAGSSSTSYKYKINGKPADVDQLYNLAYRQQLTINVLREKLKPEKGSKEGIYKQKYMEACEANHHLRIKNKQLQRDLEQYVSKPQVGKLIVVYTIVLTVFFTIVAIV